MKKIITGTAWIADIAVADANLREYPARKRSLTDLKNGAKL